MWPMGLLFNIFHSFKLTSVVLGLNGPTEKYFFPVLAAEV